MTNSDGNGASDATGTGPALGYILNLFWFCLFLFIRRLNLNTCTYHAITESLNIFMIIFYVFKGAMIIVLGDSIVDTYVMMVTGKEMWDALEAKYGVSDAGSELYVMEQFHDF